MLGEAHQIIHLIRFVATVTGNMMKWLGGLSTKKLPGNRRVLLQRELEMSHTKNGDGETTTLTIRWNRKEIEDQIFANSPLIASLDSGRLGGGEEDTLLTGPKLPS
jgi:hypothetical protein